MENHIVVFKWMGMFAHFRQFDTNSSSLSYSFPPPTVIEGMVAGLLGIERDRYYKLFSPDNLQMTVQILTVPRKILQSVNYIYAKNPNQLNMSADNIHTQIPIELVVSKNFPQDYLEYRIFLKFDDSELANDFKDIIENNQIKYLPYMGSAPFSSWIKLEGNPLKVEKLNSEDKIEINTVAPVNTIKEQSLSLEPVNNQSPAYFRELMRRTFKANREPGELMDFIWEKNRGIIKAHFIKQIYRIYLPHQVINAVFY